MPLTMKSYNLPSGEVARHETLDPIKRHHEPCYTLHPEAYLGLPAYQVWHCLLARINWPRSSGLS